MKQSLRKEYDEMLQLVEQRLGKLEPNRVNCYTCKDCGHITKTIDIDSGVTPMFIECKHCNGFHAASSFYRDIAPHLRPTFEWYRPTFEETIHLSTGLREHVLKGGLNLRKID